MNDGGKLGQLVRDTDWSLTPLGAYATWPQSLRSSLSLVLNAKGIAALYWGPEQWLLYNDAYSEALGDRHPWAFGRPMAEAQSDIAPVLGPQVDEVQRTGNGFSIENLAIVMRRHGREEKTVWTYSFSPVQGEAGDFAGVLLLATEMTQQKATERSQEKTYADLLDSRQRLAALVQASSQVIYSHNADWSEMRQLTGGGFLADTTTANPHWFEQYIPKEEQPRVWEAIQHAIATKSVFDLEHRVHQADGSVGWTLSRAVPLLDADGEITEWFGAASDITLRKQADESLRVLTERLAQQVDTQTRERDRLWQISQDPFMISDLKGRWLSVNPAWTRLLGWSEEELVGRTSEWMEHPDDRAKTRSEVQHLAEGETTLRFVNRFRTKSDSYRWFSWTAIAWDGLLYCVAHDITEQRELEESRQGLEQQLRQSQKMEAVGQLTGGLAHDFNNLLAGISGALQLMQMRMQQGRFNDFERYIATAQGAAKRAAALTHRLLAFSRQQTLTPKPTRVNRLIADMHELIQRTVGPATPIEVVGASDAWTTLVDASQLENALLNLCINARDAMPDGGRITIETANTWIDARTAQQHDMPEGQYLLLSVTDTGIGMPPEVMSRAFDPFFTTKPIGQGTGLGLSMIHGFAQQSGGQVRIYSKVGQGTTVCIYLPRHYGATAEESENHAAASLKPSSQVATVLVVDDEPTVRMLLIEVLEDLGYAWIEAADSATGLKILQSDAHIDLLVSDVGLPGGMNGRQMADAARVTRPDLKVLFITGYAENAILNHRHLAPGTSVLTKPFAIEAMAECLRSMIETE